MNSKISSLKEKMRQALNSTMKVIAEDFHTKNKRLKDKGVRIKKISIDLKKNKH